MKKISKEEAPAFVLPFVGKVMGRVWRGYGSSIFLEIGELTNDKGELTIMIEWSWRVEKEQEIMFGSWSDDSEFHELLQKLKGLMLKSISFQFWLPEVVVELSNSTWVCSFATVEGDPEWALFTESKTMRSSKGSLCFE